MNMRSAIGFIALSLPIVGCGDATDHVAVSHEEQLRTTNDAIVDDIINANRQAETDLHLITRVHLDAGQVAEFYEPEPGTILLSVAGRPRPGSKALRPDDVKGLSAVDVYRKLAPNVPVPDALVKANAVPIPTLPSAGTGLGSGESSSKPSAPLMSAPGSDLGQSRAALTDGYCGTQWVSENPCPSGWPYQWCLYDWWNGAYANGNDVVLSYANVCPEIGNVALRVITSTGHGGWWSVAQDTYRWYQRYGGQSCNPFCGYNRFNVRNTVEDASGDMFNFLGYFWF
jgi:hypothetical protein